MGGTKRALGEKKGAHISHCRRSLTEREKKGTVSGVGLGREYHVLTCSRRASVRNHADALPKRAGTSCRHHHLSECHHPPRTSLDDHRETSGQGEEGS